MGVVKDMDHISPTAQPPSYSVRKTPVISIIGFLNFAGKSKQLAHQSQVFCDAHIELAELTTSKKVKDH